MDLEQRPPHTRALMRSLADWAEAHRALHEVIQLPLSTLEEEASSSAPPLLPGSITEDAPWEIYLQSYAG